MKEPALQTSADFVLTQRRACRLVKQIRRRACTAGRINRASGRLQTGARQGSPSVQLGSSGRCRALESGFFSSRRGAPRCSGGSGSRLLGTLCARREKAGADPPGSLHKVRTARSADPPGDPRRTCERESGEEPAEQEGGSCLLGVNSSFEERRIRRIHLAREEKRNGESRIRVAPGNRSLEQQRVRPGLKDARLESGLHLSETQF